MEMNKMRKGKGKRPKKIDKIKRDIGFSKVRKGKGEKWKRERGEGDSETQRNNDPPSIFEDGFGRGPHSIEIRE